MPMGSYNINKNCRQSLIQKKWMCVSYLKHFTKQSYNKFRGCKVYHTIHPENSARGGSAVIINENIHHHEETKYETERIQATTVRIKARNTSIVVAGIYCPLSTH